MTPELIAVLALFAFLTLVLLEVSIGVALLVAGTLGTALLRDTDIAASSLASSPYNATATYTLLVIPMYVLLGSLISHAGIGTQIYRSVGRLVARLPGGLAATCVLATAIFSGISGSSAADVATFGRLSVTEMERHGYSSSYAAAVVAAAGTFAVLIPPSIGVVIYGIVAGESVGAMILAGIVPGVISALALASFVLFKGFRDRPSDPAAGVRRSAVADESAGAAPASGRGDFVGLVYAAILFLIAVGGLYAGVFTATEAGAFGAFAALVIAVIARRAKGVTLPRLIVLATREALEVTSMIFLLVIGGAVFNYFIITSGLPRTITESVLGWALDPLFIVAIFLLILIPMGMFLDGLSILLLTVPVMAPVVAEAGLDGVWFGILALKVIEIGLITPPVGINVFIIAGVVPGLSVEGVFRRIGPFILLDLALTALFFLVPDIVTWLPRRAGL